MKWFRSHHGAPMDPKWLVCARRSGQPPALVAAVWWCLMDHASQQEDRGSIEGFDAEEVAAFFQTEQTAVEAVLDALQTKGCITGKRIANWEEYQYLGDDDSAERARAYRKRKRDATVTPVTLHRDATVTPPLFSSVSVSVSDSVSVLGEEGSGKKGDDLEADFEAWYRLYPRRRARGQALKAYRAARAKASAEDLLAGVARYIAMKPDYADWCLPATWLNGERWLDEADSKPANGGKSGSKSSGDAFVRLARKRAAEGGAGREDFLDLRPGEWVSGDGVVETPGRDPRRIT